MLLEINKAESLEEGLDVVMDTGSGKKGGNRARFTSGYDSGSGVNRACRCNSALAQLSRASPAPAATALRNHKLDHSGISVWRHTLAHKVGEVVVAPSTATVVNAGDNLRRGMRAHTTSAGKVGGEWNQSWDPTSCTCRTPNRADDLVHDHAIENTDEEGAEFSL
jgi:hypothetical protein